MSVPEVYITCPFSSVHRILKSRIQQHIIKCRKSYPHISVISCPFDATHVLNPDEFEHHLNTCTSSGNVRCYQHSLEPESQVGTISLEDACNVQTNTIEEDWSGNNPSYDPIVQAAAKPIMQVPICMSKAKRKQFKKQERERFDALENEAQCSDSTIKNITPKKLSLDEPLRTPRKLPNAITCNKSTETSTDDITSLLPKMQNMSFGDVPDSLSDRNASFLNNSPSHKVDKNIRLNNIQKQKVNVSAISKNISLHNEKENISKAEINLSTTQKSNTATALADVSKLNTHTFPEEKKPDFQKDYGNKESEHQRTACVNPTLKPEFYAPAKKISTGRGYTISCEQFIAKMSKQRQQQRNESARDLASLYSYNEEENISGDEIRNDKPQSVGKFKKTGF